VRVQYISMMRQYHALLATSVIVLICAVLFSRYFFHVQVKAKDTTFGKEYGLTLTDYSGKDVHLFDYRRKVLIAYAWASWCPYCGAELQDLASLKKSYGDSIAIVAINRGEPLPVAKSFTDRLQDTGGIVFLLDPSDSFFKEIGGYAMPEMVFIDAGGAISSHQRGPIQISDVDAKIKELLK
jgi:cytochrome c biogenesis protein CcmG/thiol:disulfide interchange protein DsbE